MPQYDPQFELTDMVFDEVSLVPSGDDPMARITLAKSDRNNKNGDRHSRSSTVTRQQDKRGSSMPEQKPISKDDLDPEVAEYIDTLEGALDDAFGALQEAGVIDADGNLIETDDDGNGDGNAADDDRELALAKADPATRAYIAKMEADRETLSKQVQEAQNIAKAERDERERRDFVSKAATDFPFIGDATEVGGLLQRLSKSNPEDAAKVEALLKAANGKIESSDIFTEIGKLGGGAPNSDVEARAAELRKADPSMSPEAARAAVYAADPKLYDESVKGN